MAFRDALLEVEEIEQLALIDRLPTHHDPPPPLKASTKRNHDSPIITSDFFNSIDQQRSSATRTVAVLKPPLTPIQALAYAVTMISPQLGAAMQRREFIG